MAEKDSVAFPEEILEAASMAKWFKSFMRLYLDPGPSSIGINNLIIIFFLRKGK